MFLFLFFWVFPFAGLFSPKYTLNNPKHPQNSTKKASPKKHTQKGKRTRGTQQNKTKTQDETHNCYLVVVGDGGGAFLTQFGAYHSERLRVCFMRFSYVSQCLVCVCVCASVCIAQNDTVWCGSLSAFARHNFLVECVFVRTCVS